MAPERKLLLAVLAFGAATGLCGIRAGVPGPARLRIFPPSLRPTPEIARRFEDSWTRLYQEIRRSHKEMRAEEPVTHLKGLVELAPAWTDFPDILLNSYRSFLLQSVNPDEKKPFTILSQMRPWRLDFQPLYLHYGGSFIYPLGVFLKAASWVGAVRLVPSLSHYLLHPEDMGRLYVMGRLFILLFHLGSLWLLYDMGRRLGGWAAGICAALFFAICPAIVLNIHIVKPHPYAAFWCLAAARFALIALETGRSREYLLAGVCAGLAAGATSVYIPFAAAAPLAWAWRLGLGRSKPEELARAAGAVALAALTIMLTNSYLLTHFKDYLWEMSYVRPGDWTLLHNAGHVFHRGMGFSLLAASLAGIAAAAGSREPARTLVATAAAGSLVAIWLCLRGAGGFGSTMAIRFYHPALGLACLAAADLVTRLPGRARALALILILADAGLWSAVHLGNLRLEASERSTRSQAADWIEANVPAGATVGMIRLPEPASTAPFRFDRYRLVLFESPRLVDAKRRPQYLVLSWHEKGGFEGLLEDYEPAAAFESWRAGWADISDGSGYFNVDMYVYRRRA